MKLEILSPEKTIYRGEVEQVNLPGQMGPFMVLTHHAPIISTLVEGDVTYLPKGKQSESDKIAVPIMSGFVEVREDIVSVCVEVRSEIVEKVEESEESKAKEELESL